MHISKNETSNIFYDNFYLPSEESRYLVSTHNPSYSNIYTKTQFSQKKNIPLPHSIRKTGIKSPIKLTDNFLMTSRENESEMDKDQERNMSQKSKITSIEINNPLQIAKQDISFRNTESNDPNANTANQFSSKEFDTLLFNNTKPEGYLNIVSSKSFNIPDSKPDEYIKRRNKIREEREKLRSLSNLILHGKSSKEKSQSKKLMIEQISKQNRSLTPSPNNQSMKSTLNMILSKRESKNNVIITRGMRIDRGGVVDLGYSQSKKLFNITNFNNIKLHTYSQKDKIRAVLCIQLWWRRILLQYKATIDKVILIQTNYKRHYNRQKQLLIEKKKLELKEFVSLLDIVYKNLYAGFLSLKEYNQIRINHKEKDALNSLDFMLVVNILVIKQRTLDRIKEKSTVNKIFKCVSKMKSVFNFIRTRNIIMNGDILVEKLKMNQKILKLNELFDHLPYNQLKRRFIQYKTGTIVFTPNKQVKRQLNNFTSLFALLIYKVIDERIKQQNQAILNELNDYDPHTKREIMLKSKTRLRKVITEKSYKNHFNLFAKWIIWKRKTKTHKVLKSVRMIQTQTKNHLAKNVTQPIRPIKPIKIIRKIFYKRLLNFPFDKIIQEAKRRTLIKSLYGIRKKKLNNLFYAFKKIIKYTEIKHLVQDTCARIIQRKFFNSFPHIKERHFEAVRIKDHKVNIKIMINAVRLIQRKYRFHYFSKQANGYYILKELFIYWIIKLRQKKWSLDMTSQRRYFAGAKVLLRFFITNIRNQD